MEAYSDITRQSDAVSAFSTGGGNTATFLTFVTGYGCPGDYVVMDTFTHPGMTPLDLVTIEIVDPTAIEAAMGVILPPANTPDMLDVRSATAVAGVDEFQVFLEFDAPVQGDIYIRYTIYTGVTL